MADYRIRNIDAALWARVQAQAGDDLRDVVIGLLALFAAGKIDPRDPAKQQRAAGRARMGKLTKAQRSANARAAVQARWSRKSEIGPSAFYSSKVK